MHTIELLWSLPGTQTQDPNVGVVGTSIYTHICNEVTLVWGSLRLAQLCIRKITHMPDISYTSFSTCMFAHIALASLLCGSTVAL